MDYTDLPQEVRIARSKKQMLWFAIASLVMMFAGLTSAYVVSRGRKDWVEIELPEEFIFSTGLIVLSSFTLWLAKKSIIAGKQSMGTLLTVLTFILGAVFVYLQFAGFEALLDRGIHLTGFGTSVNASFIYLIVVAHLAHIAAGLIALLVMTIKTIRGKYTADTILGFELGSIFWHFVDILWVYLLLFLLFAKDIF